MPLIHTDAFAAADNTVLGAPWVKRTGSVGTLNVFDNKCQLVSGDGPGRYHIGTAPVDANQVISTRLIFVGYGSNIANYRGVMMFARASDSADTYYRAGYLGGRWHIGKMVAGTYTELAGIEELFGGAGAQNIPMRFYAVGTSLVFGKGSSLDTPFLTATDSSITATGFVGLDVNSDNAQTDDYSASDGATLPAASPVLSLPTVTAVGNGTATIGVTTNTAGTAINYQQLPAATAAPTAAAINASPSGTIIAGSVVAGVNTVALTGLTNNVAIKYHFATAGPSNVVSTASFTPTAGPVITSHPANATVTAPNPGAFTAAATGADAGGWQRNAGNVTSWVDIAGSGPNNLTTGATAVTGGTGGVWNNGDGARGYYTYLGGARVYTNGSVLIVNAAGDVTAPVLTAAVAAGGTLSAAGGVTTDEGNGFLYYVTCASATPPTKAQVKLGQDANGAAALYAGSQVVASAGAKTFNATPLAAGTGRYHFSMHEDAASNQSNVLGTAAFTVASAGTFGFVSEEMYFNTDSGPQLGVAGRWSVWPGWAGNFVGITPVSGLGTTSATTGRLAVTGLPSAGSALMIFQDTALTGVYWQTIVAA